MNRLKVLIVAHEFSPDQGSECAVGWNIVLNLCKYHDLTVIYAKTNQFHTSNYEESVQKYLEVHGNIEGLTLVPLSQPKLTKFLVFLNLLISSRSSAIGFAPFYYLGYKAWQKTAYHLAINLDKSIKFDLVHHLTSISFREPGYLWRMNVPFIWGPCSGLVKMPSPYYRDLSFREIFSEMLRRFSNYFQSNFSSSVKSAMKRAALIYPVSHDEMLFFQKKTKAVVKQMLDVGTYFRDKTELNNNETERLRLIWIGRMVYTKALHLLLKALSQDDLLQLKIDLSIVGDGPLTENYQKLAKNLDLKNIKWLGNVPHNTIFQLLKQSDVLIHTSIKEATSAVLLESLTQGCPVICHDAFGMSYAIDDTCGIKIPLNTPDESISGFRNAITKIESDRSYLMKLKHGAFIRASSLSWQSKASKIAIDYNEIIVSKRN